MAPVTEDDLWRIEHEVLGDLMSFVDEHAPGTERPLPVLFWRVGPARTLAAEVHAFEADPGGKRSDPRAVVAEYASVLGTEVEEHSDGERALIVARGRIGPERDGGPDGRTQLMVRAEVPLADSLPPGGRGAIP